jgi:hypothetical protein
MRLTGTRILSKTWLLFKLLASLATTCIIRVQPEEQASGVPCIVTTFSRAFPDSRRWTSTRACRGIVPPFRPITAPTYSDDTRIRKRMDINGGPNNCNIRTFPYRSGTTVFWRAGGRKSCCWACGASKRDARQNCFRICVSSGLVSYETDDSPVAHLRQNAR